MAEYRFSGMHSFAPDRGSPNGDKDPFTEEFQANNDEEALEWVKKFKEGRVKIVQARLVRIVVREKTERVQLRSDT